MAVDYYKSFYDDAWDIKSEVEKRNLLLDIERHLANKQGRRERDVVIKKDIKCLGYYSIKDDVHTISPEALEKAGLAFYTVAHEGRHAYQSDVIQGKLTNTEKNKTIWTKNWNGYLDPNNLSFEYFDYMLQPLEKDANEYALEELKIFQKKCKSRNIEKEFKKLEFRFQSQIDLAKIEYGKNYEEAIQNKVDIEFSKKAQDNSYSSINEKLSKEGIRDNYRFIDRIITYDRASAHQPRATAIAKPIVEEPVKAATEQQVNKPADSDILLAIKAVQNGEAAPDQIIGQTFQSDGDWRILDYCSGCNKGPETVALLQNTKAGVATPYTIAHNLPYHDTLSWTKASQYAQSIEARNEFEKQASSFTKEEVTPLRIYKETDKAVMVKLDNKERPNERLGVWVHKDAIKHKDGHVTALSVPGQSGFNVDYPFAPKVAEKAAAKKIVPKK